MIADVDNSFAPGLFQGAVDGVRGVAKYLNATGGLAGRKVVVDFIDSRLSPDEARNAMIKACEEDFAMVGTSAVFLTTVEPQLNCVDKAGEVTGLPDIPFVTTEIVQQCSPITFPIAPPQIICSTRDEHPQTYQASRRARLLLREEVRRRPPRRRTCSATTRSRPATRRSRAGSARSARSAASRTATSTSPRSRPRPSTHRSRQELKSNDGNYAQCTGPSTARSSSRKEAKIQGVDGVEVWDCGTQCYDPSFLEEGGADVEGQYADVLYLPFLDAKDRKANKMAADFVKYTGKDNAGKLGAVYAWAAGIALRDAVNTIVDENGNNGLTRAALLEALGNIHEFDADGMFGKIDLGGRKVDAVPRAHAGQGREVRPGDAEEGGHVRLRREERDRDAARPGRSVRRRTAGAERAHDAPDGA